MSRLPRYTRLSRGGPIKPKKRKPAEKLRIYGSAARIAWMKRQPCLICRFTPSENAHAYTGGMGRKAGAAAIVPLCRLHHAEQHAFGTRTLEDDYGVDLRWEAERTEAAWQKHLARSAA